MSRSIVVGCSASNKRAKELVVVSRAMKLAVMSRAVELVIVSQVGGCVSSNRLTVVSRAMEVPAVFQAMNAIVSCAEVAVESCAVRGREAACGGAVAKQFVQFFRTMAELLHLNLLWKPIP